VSKFRVPHGTYVRDTPDWFDYRRVAGAGFSVATTAAYSHVSLYNNATDGSCLHVCGLAVQCLIAAGYVSVLLFAGHLGTTGNFASVPVSPVQLMGPGQIYAGQQAGFPAGPGIWTAGLNGGLDYWPYGFALCILQPGLSLMCVGSAQNAEVTAAFHWLVMGPEQGFY
jgi:hypothetical protein